MKKFYEETLEDLIYFTAKTAEGRETLKNCGLEIKGKLLRQIVIGKYGRTDLVSIYINGKENGKHKVYVTVYELKKDFIGRKVVFQVSKYLYGINRYFEKSIFSQDYKLKLNAVIIGSKVEDDHYYELISAVCPSIEVFTYDYQIDGLKFKKVEFQDHGSCFGNLDQLIEEIRKSSYRELCGYIQPLLPI